MGTFDKILLRDVGAGKGMRELKIIQTITVKQILTEKSKKSLQKTFTERIQQLQREIEQLRFEMKRFEKLRKYDVNTIRNYFEKEINERKEKMKLVEFQLEQLEILPIGSEIKERELEGIIDVNIGDNWNDIQTGKTIVIKDGIVENIY